MHLHCICNPFAMHLLNKYEDEVKYNPYFRGLAEKVQSILNKTSVK